jgi:hypothetical protein
MYRSIGVNVVVIQQPPYQHEQNIVGLYKKLLNDGQLTDTMLRKYSLSRTEYDKEQKPFFDFFNRFNKTRGFSLIRIDDVICDDAVCLIGTSQKPFYNDRFHLSWVGAAKLVHRTQTYLAL